MEHLRGASALVFFVGSVFAGNAHALQATTSDGYSPPLCVGKRTDRAVVNQDSEPSGQWCVAGFDGPNNRARVQPIAFVNAGAAQTASGQARFIRICADNATSATSDLTAGGMSNYEVRLWFENSGTGSKENHSGRIFPGDCHNADLEEGAIMIGFINNGPSLAISGSWRIID